MFYFPIHYPITGSAIRNDVGFADNSRGGHAERPKNSLLQQVTVKLSGYFVNENAQDDVGGIAVIPLRARRKIQRQSAEFPEKLVFGVIVAKIDERSALLLERFSFVVVYAGRSA